MKVKEKMNCLRRNKFKVVPDYKLRQLINDYDRLYTSDLTIEFNKKQLLELEAEMHELTDYEEKRMIKLSSIKETFEERLIRKRATKD